MLKKLLLLAFLIGSGCEASNAYVRQYVFEWLFVDKNVSKTYLEKAAGYEVPSADAAYVLGTFYLSDTPFGKDLKKAGHYLTIAANLNHSGAIKSIGDGYYSGDIKEKNINTALEYYEKSASMGYGPAQFNAGIVLLNNAKCRKDLKRAVFWLDKAYKNTDDLAGMAKDILKYKKDAENKLRKAKK